MALVSLLLDAFHALTPDVGIDAFDGELAIVANWLGGHLGLVEPTIPVASMAIMVESVLSVFVPGLLVFVVIRWVRSCLPVVGS